MNSDYIEPVIREELIIFLPRAIGTALSAYEVFLDQVPPTDAKEYKSYQDACKVAVGHIELLLKLATWTDKPGTAAEEEVGQDLQPLITNALKEIHDKNIKT